MKFPQTKHQIRLFEKASAMKLVRLLSCVALLTVVPVHALTIVLPDSVENGAVIPVNVTLGKPMTAGHQLQLLVNEQLAVQLDVIDGSVTEFETRIKGARATTTIVARTLMAENEIDRASISVKINGPVASIGERPTPVGPMKARNTDGDIKLLITGQNGIAGHLVLQGTGLHVEIMGGAVLANNPLIRVKANVAGDVTASINTESRKTANSLTLRESVLASGESARPMQAGGQRSRQAGPQKMPPVPTLRSGELIVKTRDECGIVILQRGDQFDANEIKRIADLNWEGACIDGLAMGEGRLYEAGSAGSNQEVRGWAWYGRPYGEVTWKFLDGGFQTAFFWDGKTVTYTTLELNKAAWSDKPGGGTTINDGDTVVMTSRRNKFTVNRIGLKTGSYESHVCPDPGSAAGCEAVWKKHAAPVIANTKSFIEANRKKANARHTETVAAIEKLKEGLLMACVGATSSGGGCSRDGLSAEQRRARSQTQDEVLARAEGQRRQIEDDKRKKSEAEQKKRDAELAAEAARMNEKLAEEQKAEKERRDKERKEGISILSNALVAAAGGKTSGERKKLAVESIQQSAGGGSPGAVGKNYEIQDIIVLDNIGAPSLFGCMKVEWIDETRPTTNYLGSVYRGPEYGVGTNDNYYYDRRILVASNRCEQKIMYLVATCHDHNMLQSGNKGRDSWTMGELVGVAADLHTGPVLGKGQGIVIAEVYRHGSRETADRKSPIQVAVGAWQPDSIFLPNNMGRTEAGERLKRKQLAFHHELNKVTTGKSGTNALTEWHGNTPSQFRNDRDGYTHSPCQSALLKEVWNSTQ